MTMIGTTRQFATTFTNDGGMLYHDTFANDETSHTYLYDVVLSLPSAAEIANIEMDMNQVLSNGDTVIFGFQCDGWSSTWDYTENTGTEVDPVGGWVHSSQPCNPSNWEGSESHHIQILYSRDDDEDVSYEAVWVDGKMQVIGDTVFDGYALGWAVGTNLLNFQIDGKGASGNSTVLMSSLSVSRW